MRIGPATDGRPPPPSGPPQPRDAATSYSRSSGASLPPDAEMTLASGSMRRIARKVLGTELNRSEIATGRLPALPCPTNPQPLFDHLVGAGEARLSDCQADRRRGPEIDDQFEVGGLVDGDVGGLLAFENPVHALRGTSIPVGKAVPVGHEAALLRPFLADEH